MKKNLTLTIKNRKIFFSWDYLNWSKAYDFWVRKMPELTKQTSLLGLEIGSGDGMLSILFSKLGHHIVCSDLINPHQRVREIHFEHKITNIEYKAINALQIPYHDTFDFIFFKSVLGAVFFYDNDIRKCVSEIYKALKPGGCLLFAENLASTRLHTCLRKKHRQNKFRWNDLTYEELDSCFSIFGKRDFKTFGFLGLFGTNETLRFVLGLLDNLVCYFVPANKRYVVFGVCQK